MAKNTVYDVYVCVDCGYYLANGLSGCEPPEWTPEQIKERWQGYHLVNGDSDKDRTFSWSPCEGCASHLGGYRFHSAIDCHPYCHNPTSLTCSSIHLNFP